MRHLVWISIGFKQEELNYLHRGVLNRQVQERLAHYVKTVLYLTTLRLCLEHLVHLDEFLGLIMLDKLEKYKKRRDETWP